MAETSKGKKFVKVKGYTRVVDGKKVRVGAFDRSTPKTSKGKKKYRRSQAVELVEMPSGRRRRPSRHARQE